ncbi:hypothetical protein [Streptomyces sp. ME18-1-4]|uniref:hypothetical protein n=1 Tax=Streptomyces sp. ME18-1-4 TaxID=3028685 RepID=UPI0029AA64BC|nr:hypothetical protein [Streptomyces sp. ME18-1-4]MDX3242055.1 hypothetical protein [Streptomyces sp. ME18-1-4]
MLHTCPGHDSTGAGLFKSYGMARAQQPAGLEDEAEGGAAQFAAGRFAELVEPMTAGPLSL